MSTAPCQQSAYTHAVQHKHSTEGHRIQFAGQAHHQILPCQEKDILFPLLLPSHLQHGCWPWCSLEVLLNQFIQLQLQITIFFPSFFFFCSGYILVSSSIMLAVRQAAVGASDPSAWLGVRQRRNEGCQQDSPPKFRAVMSAHPILGNCTLSGQSSPVMGPHLSPEMSNIAK